MMLKKGLTLQITSVIDHCLKEKTGLMKDQLGGRVITEFVA